MTSLESSIEQPAATKKQVAAWSLWDWGSAAFNAVIVTFVFSVYLTNAVGCPEPGNGCTDIDGYDYPGPFSPSTWLGFAIGGASLVIALLAPVMGQQSDASGRRKRTLALLTSSVIVIMALMFFVKDDYSYLWLGLLLIAIGLVLFELAQVPYFAMLRQVSTPANVGRISGIGWGAGYLGGIILLLVCFVGFIAGDGDTRGLLNLTTDGGMNIRLIAILAAVWFAVFALPVFLSVPELPASASSLPKTSFIDSYRVLFREIRQMWATDRTTLKYLIASALFRDGLAGVFTFGAVIAVSVYGFEEGNVLIFGVVANVIAAAGAIGAGWLDDTVGPRRVIVFSLCAMLVAGVILLFIQGSGGFWIFGLILCLFVGPAQSAARTYLTRLSAPGREGQNFGLYAMTGRAASFLAPTLFGVAAAIGGDDRWGIIGIMLVLGAGLIALLLVPKELHDKAAA